MLWVRGEKPARGNSALKCDNFTCQPNGYHSRLKSRIERDLVFRRFWIARRSPGGFNRGSDFRQSNGSWGRFDVTDPGSYNKRTAELFNNRQPDGAPIGDRRTLVTCDPRPYHVMLRWRLVWPTLPVAFILAARTRNLIGKLEPSLGSLARVG